MVLAIIPAYNEEERIGGVVASLLGYVEKVVVVDDGSFDNTAREARAAGAIVLLHEINRGQGAALETGQAYARRIGADRVVHFDGDGQFQPEDITHLLSVMEDTGADIVLGSRFLGKESNLPWLKRYIILPVGRWVDRLFGGPRLTDAHNGFRLLNSRALMALTISQDRMAHATEIPQLIAQERLRYAECPVTVTYHEFGQGAGGGARVLRDLLIGRFLS